MSGFSILGGVNIFQANFAVAGMTSAIFCLMLMTTCAQPRFKLAP